MSNLRTAAEDYLAIRRSLGFKLEKAGGLLLDFIDDLEDAGATTITTDLAVTWATKPRDVDPGWWSQRLSVVRGFARHLQAIDPAVQVPPRDLLPRHNRRATPYLFTPGDIDRLMAAAQTLTPPHRAATAYTLVGLLAATGMRLGETLRLDRDDVELGDRLITIRHAKRDKTRQLPLHPTVAAALHSYTQVRDERIMRPTTPAFFVSTVTGGRLSQGFVHPVFRRLVRQAGLKSRSERCRPRPHALRHSFAVNSLIGWYRDGEDIAARLPRLSTWLGHSDPASTYWYLQASPELLALAGQRLEDGLGALP
jgi:integrase/recombinase XerD